jgi:hypothetical protein
VITKITGSFVSFDYRVPAALMEGFHQPYDRIVINNPHVFVLILAGKTGPPRTLAFRKSDKTWHQIPAQTGTRGTMRGFGRFIAIAEASPKVEQTGEPAGSAILSSPKIGKVRESAGKAAWRTTAGRMGPSIFGRFNISDAVYPGRLHLYDVETEQINTIVTNQADSEVLLVEDYIVYYRSSDKLYLAKITKSGIGVPRLMATAEAIRDAHWAFIKH